MLCQYIYIIYIQIDVGAVDEFLCCAATIYALNETAKLSYEKLNDIIHQ